MLKQSNSIFEQCLFPWDLDSELSLLPDGAFHATQVSIDCAHLYSTNCLACGARTWLQVRLHFAA